MKTCFKCKTAKPYDDFYKHPQMADGYLGKCKECAKVDVRARRLANHDYYLQYDRARAKTEKRKRLPRTMEEKFPEKARARRQTQKAVKSGKIVKQPCAVCGNPNVDAHHPDYSKPLDVRWLCRTHHMELHRTPRGCTGTKPFYRQRRSA